MAAIMDDLRKKPLIATRVHIDPKNMYGRPDGAAVTSASRFNLIPPTGVPQVDELSQRATSLVGFGPKAVKNTVIGTIKGAFCGAVVGTAVGLARHLVAAIGSGISTRKLPKVNLLMMAATASVGLLLGSGLGFALSIRKNIRDFKGILFGR
jgi:hypothetical protein